MANENDNRGPVSRFGVGPDDRTYVEKNLVLAAGAEAQISGMWDWCEILASDFDTIEISFNEGRSFQRLPRGLAPMFPRTKVLTLRNYGVDASTLQFASGMGEPPRDSRLVVVAGTNVAVEGIPDGEPVVVQGVAGMVPVATQDDPLPAVDMQSVVRYGVAIGNTPVFSAVANVNGAWIYWAQLEATTNGNVYTDAPRIVNDDTGCEYLHAPTNFFLNNTTNPKGHVSRDRPWFVPAGQAVSIDQPHGGYCGAMVNFKLVP